MNQFVTNLPGLLAIAITIIKWCSYQPSSTMALMWICVVAEIYEGGMGIYQGRGCTISKTGLLPSCKVVIYMDIVDSVLLAMEILIPIPQDLWKCC